MNDVTVLTGASRGIGVSIAETLAERGGHLVLTARDPEGLAATAERVRARGAEATVVPADLSRAEARAAVVEAAEAAGPVVGLVNNAALEVTLAVADMTPEQIDAQVMVNLTAPIQLTRALLPGMLARKRGAICMVSSMSGKSPTPFNALYSATKFGLNGFTSSLRIELAGTGVHAGVVCPSFVADAGMWANSGLTAPASMREVPLTAVTKAVVDVLDGKAEVLVTPMPVRPLLALAQIWPWLDGWVLERMGVTGTLRERAASQAAD